MVLSKKEVGLLIKKARDHKSKIIDIKYTQNMLAKDLQLSRGYIGDIENGRIYPNYDLITKISEKCEVPLGFFDDNTTVIYKTNDDEIMESSILTKPAPIYCEITDIKKAMDLILDQPGLMLNGEMLSNESKIALANAIQLGLAYAEQMQKKERD